LSNGAIELDAYNVAEVRDTSEATVVQLQRAQRSCPTAAITIHES